MVLNKYSSLSAHPPSHVTYTSPWREGMIARPSQRKGRYDIYFEDTGTINSNVSVANIEPWSKKLRRKYIPASTPDEAVSVNGDKQHAQNPNTALALKKKVHFNNANNSRSQSTGETTFQVNNTGIATHTKPASVSKPGQVGKSPVPKFEEISFSGVLDKVSNSFTCDDSASLNSQLLQALLAAAAISEAAIAASNRASNVTSDAVKAASMLSLAVSKLIPTGEVQGTIGNTDSPISRTFKLQGLVESAIDADDRGLKFQIDTQNITPIDDVSALCEGDVVLIQTRARISRIHENDLFSFDFGGGLVVPNVELVITNEHGHGDNETTTPVKGSTKTSFCPNCLQKNTLLIK